MNTCMDCTYFIEPDDKWGDTFCNRYPPTMLAGGVSAFPTVGEESCCGEFVDIDEPTTRDVLQSIASDLSTMKSDLDGISRWEF